MAAEPARLRLIPGGETTPEGSSPASGPRSGPLTQLSDSQLVSLVASGEARAFEALYRRHAPFALNLAVRLQGNATDVEDLVHDAFVRAHERLMRAFLDPEVFDGAVRLVDQSPASRQTSLLDA